MQDSELILWADWRAAAAVQRRLLQGLRVCAVRQPQVRQQHLRQALHTPHQGSTSIPGTQLPVCCTWGQLQQIVSACIVHREVPAAL